MVPPRLMAISSGPIHVHWLDELLDDGVDALQIREKHLNDGELLRWTKHVVDQCREHSLRRGTARGRRLTVLVNGRADIAQAAGADGVHLPGHGLPISGVRRAFPELLVGRSTHHDQEIVDAARQGAHYVTFGPVQATPSKERYGPPQGFDALRSAVEAGRGLPVLALGGLDASGVLGVQQAGAWGLAGIRVFRDAGTRCDLVRAARQAWARD